MTARISGGGGAKSEAGATSALSTEVMLIQPGTVVIGIDPSLRGTGWGVVRVADPEPIHLASGTIRCPERWQRTRCLGEIGKEIAGIMARFQPSECACEGLFFAQNLQTALIMGEARGAALATVARTGTEIHEISPRKVKLAIVGYGAAQKIAVAKMVQRQLGLAETPDADAADALALALVMVQELRNPLGPASKRV